MSWLYLSVAIVLEVCGTICMKLADGLSNLVPTVLLFVSYGLCFVMMTLALKRLEVGVAYALWSGVGTALIAVIGVVWFREPMTVVKALSLVLIILGVVGLHCSVGAH